MKSANIFVVIVTVLVIGCTTAKPPVQSVDMVANAEPYEVGIVSANFSTFLGIGMKSGTFTIDFVPRTNEIVLVTKNQGNETLIYLNRESRDIILFAANEYLDQFDNRALSQNGKKLDVYGKFLAFMKWGMLTLNAEGTATISVGYEFQKNAPYFTLTIPETTNDRYLSTTRSSRIKQSGYFQIFFNRSQLIEFAEYLVQENLESTLEEKNVSRASTDPDEY